MCYNNYRNKGCDLPQEREKKMITAKELLEITKKSEGSAYQEANKILKKEEPCMRAAAEEGRRCYRFTLKDYYFVSTKCELIEALGELFEEFGFKFFATESTGNCTVAW